VELDLREVFAELHGVGEGPLVGADFTEGGAHEDGADLVYYQQFGDVVGVGPHYCEFLSAPLPIELGDRLRVADCHNVEDAVIGCADAFVAFVPYLEYLGALVGHHHRAPVPEHPQHEEILL
jgi:hypothetical protein